MGKVKTNALLFLIFISAFTPVFSYSYKVQARAMLEIKMWFPRGGDAAVVVLPMDENGNVQAIYGLEAYYMQYDASGFAYLRFFVEKVYSTSNSQCDNYDSERCVDDMVMFGKSKGYIIVSAQNDGNSISDNELYYLEYREYGGLRANYTYPNSSPAQIGDKYSNSIKGIIFAYDFSGYNKWIQAQRYIIPNDSHNLNNCPTDLFDDHSTQYLVDYYINYYSDPTRDDDTDFQQAFGNMVKFSYLPPVQQC